MTALQTKSAADPSVLRDCHPLVHAIGFAAFNQLNSVSEAMIDGADWCTSGYYHGVFEGAFTQTDDPIALMQTVCVSQPDHTFRDWQCHHGIGHGLMFYYENDLPAATDACHRFPDSFQSEACINGMFMENFVADGIVHKAPYRQAENPLYPCAEQAEADQAHCYATAAHYFLTLYPNAYADGFKWCKEAGTQEANCVRGIASRAMRDQLAHPEVVEALCRQAGDFEPWCIIGMTSVYLSHIGNSSTGDAFCASLSLSHQVPCLLELEDFRTTYESI